MASYNNLEIYRQSSDMSKELRRSINNMPRQYKFNIGMRIINLLSDIKYQIYLCNTRFNEERLVEIRKLKDMLAHLKIYLEECIEDKVLLLNTKFSIQTPLKRLNDTITQIKKWEMYTKQTLGKNNTNNNDIPVITGNF